MKLITDFIAGILPLPDEALTAFIGKLEPFSFEKKSVIVTPEKNCDYLFFITRGGIREFIIDDKGNDISVWFGFEKDVAVCLASFISGRPSYTGLQATEDCELLGIYRKDLYELYDSFSEIERLGRIMTEIYFVATEEYRRGFHHLTASQRYDKLMERSPEIIQRVSLTHIASYIGVSLETLSRIRAKF